MLARKVALALSLLVAGTQPPSSAKELTDPLPSWKDGAAKRALIDFVGRVTKGGGPDFEPPEERIATFDNDGTLWPEEPIPVELAFALDRVKALAPQHPEWKSEQPFKGVLDGDMGAIERSGERGVFALMGATHVGNTTEEFARIVSDWMTSARHPKLHRPYTEVVYQPMLEVLAYLRANGFKTYVVTGGGVEFVRAWAERTYGIPPEQVIGSRAKMKFEVRNGKPVLVTLAEVDLIDDGAGKPVGIQQTIGRRPTAAFGNSDGDFEMLEWATAAPGHHLGLLVHHTDAAREFAYDRSAKVGKLSHSLDEANKHAWVVVDMKQDWKRIYPFDKQ